MTKRLLCLLAVVLVGCTSAERSNGPGRLGVRPPAGAAAGERLSALHHPVSTQSRDAQRHFDDGMTLIYAFNHDEAVRSFNKALKADPKLAMAHWGIALAVGPNYNVDVDAAREKQGFAEIEKARALAKGVPQVEKDYIEALAKRFSNAEKPDLKKLARDYVDAMRDLSAKYPEDLQAATLYADAMMNLRPWALWSKDYKPAEGTEQIVATLESVLRRDPDHIGANHLYIHAVEASRNPERALEAAARLPVLAPQCGHLVHMPSHIYARVGDHESAVTSNEAAVDADREYFAKTPEGKGGMYEMMYYPHNMHFLAYAHGWGGHYASSRQWAKEIYDHAAPHVEHMPMMEGFTVVPIGIDVKFRRWDDILRSQSPNEKTMPITTAMWHFGRGMAHASKGDLEAARSEREKMMAIKLKLAPDTMLGMLNKAHHVLEIAQNVLDAKIVAQRQRYSDAERLLREAVRLEDDLTYMEPPDWLSPARESLGGVMLTSGNAAGAEKVFREDLDRNPRGGRSLFGLWKSLEAQKKTYEANLVRQRFETAWKNSDTKLRVEDL